MTKRIVLLVEGQTEERFAKDILQPHFQTRDIHLSATILTTKQVAGGANFKGGISSFAKLEKDLNRLLADHTALVSTMFDYYGLPNDFPGSNIRATVAHSVQKVQLIEKELEKYYQNRKNFKAFLLLHEFEALLFASESHLPSVFPGETHAARDFQRICSELKPEDINDTPTHAPSKRLLGLYPAYNKVSHGPLVADRIGLDQIRAKCPHFADWMTYLENYFE